MLSKMPFGLQLRWAIKATLLGAFKAPWFSAKRFFDGNN